MKKIKGKFSEWSKKRKIITAIICAVLLLGLGVGIPFVLSTGSNVISTYAQEDCDEVHCCTFALVEDEEALVEQLPFDLEEGMTIEACEDYKTIIDEDGTVLATISVAELPYNRRNATNNSTTYAPQGNTNVATNTNTGNTANNPNTGTTNNNNIANNTSTNSTTNTPVSCNHRWERITRSETVQVDKGTYQTVTIREAWAETTPVHEMVAQMRCNCGVILNPATMDQHALNHMNNGENSGWRTEWVQVQTGTQTINHPAVTERQWVPNIQTVTRQVATNQERCTICGDIRTR